MLLFCPDQSTFVTADGVKYTPAEPADAESAALTLALPAQCCVFTEVEVSRAESRHLAQILPWKLEESLIDPAESLHFAPSRTLGGRVGITAISRNLLQGVLDHCKLSGISPTAVICELELVPWREGQWSLWLQADAKGEPVGFLVRYARHAGLACLPAMLSEILKILAAEQHAWPHRLCLYTPDGTADIAYIPESMHSLVQISACHWSDPDPDACCNLLQGAFAASLPWSHWWQQWRLVAVLVLGLLLSDLAFTWLQNRQLQQEIAQQELSIMAEFSSVLPGADMVDARLQLQRAVAAMGGSNKAGFLSLLTRLTPVLSDQGDAVIQSLDYDNASGELQLLIQTSSFDAAENLRARLQAAGLQAELVGSSSDGKVNSSRLKIRA